MTEFNLELAIKMWNEGKSAKTIAAYFGVTRNAVIGKIHRARYNGVYVVQKANPKKRALMPPKAKIIAIEGTQPMKQGLRIYDLEHNQCRYSTGEDNGEYVFCGVATSDRAYCDEHHKLCHSKPEPKKKQYFNIDLKRKFLHYR